MGLPEIKEEIPKFALVFVAFAIAEAPQPLAMGAHESLPGSGPIFEPGSSNTMADELALPDCALASEALNTTIALTPRTQNESKSLFVMTSPTAGSSPGIIVGCGAAQSQPNRGYSRAGSHFLGARAFSFKAMNWRSSLSLAANSPSVTVHLI
jgi:hypothetical protein